MQRNGTWWRCDDTKIQKLTQLPIQWAPNSPKPPDQQARIFQTNNQAQKPNEEPKLLFYEVTEREYDTEYIQNLLYATYQSLAQIYHTVK